MILRFQGDLDIDLSCVSLALILLLLEDILCTVPIVKVNSLLVRKVTLSPSCIVPMSLPATLESS